MAKANKTKTMKTTITQTFSFTAPTAMSVQLVGDFTHWEEKPIQLQKGENGVWQATVELEPGTHHYLFLVDGHWRDDPECTLRVGNPFGTENMVREVRQPDAGA
jgi:1,4-alpha-glucan branching enzyme